MYFVKIAGLWVMMTATPYFEPIQMKNPGSGGHQLRNGKINSLLGTLRIIEFMRTTVTVRNLIF